MYALGSPEVWMSAPQGVKGELALLRVQQGVGERRALHLELESWDRGATNAFHLSWNREKEG